jgi:serine/threonine protein kinase
MKQRTCSSLQPNILLDSELRACLTDFGLAGVLHHTIGFTTVTGLRGSIRWMSPELLGIDSTPSKPTMQSDVWALGIVWWEVSHPRCFVHSKLIILVDSNWSDTIPQPVQRRSSNSPAISEEAPTPSEWLSPCDIVGVARMLGMGPSRSTNYGEDRWTAVVDLDIKRAEAS